MIGKMTKEWFVEWFHRVERNNGVRPDPLSIWYKIESDREAIREEVRKEVTEELLRDAMIPEWNTHKGCSGARIIYEYGAFGDVSWTMGPGDKGSHLNLKNGGYVRSGTWYKSPIPKTRPMTREELLRAFKESEMSAQFVADKLKDETLMDLLSVRGIPTETTD